MTWPPNKSFTSTKIRQGYRHFVAINYGCKGKQKWVNLVSVLDGDVRFTVLWEELNDPNIWTPGWSNLTRDQSNPPDDLKNNSLIPNQDKSCLHPSLDSGLYLPTPDVPLRLWLD